jgi:hypothetical protein
MKTFASNIQKKVLYQKAFLVEGRGSRNYELGRMKKQESPYSLPSSHITQFPIHPS